MQQNASEVSIIIILAPEAKFLTTADSKKVSTNKCDINAQPEIAICSGGSTLGPVGYRPPNLA